MKKHYIELDSLRGLAALSVLIGHFLLVYTFAEPNTYKLAGYESWNIFKYSPLHIFGAGYEAVIFFFLLSGFVLSLAYYKIGFKLNLIWYKSYMIKRFFRIYLPYIVSIFVAILLILLLKPSVISGASDFVNRIWTRDITSTDIINHIILIGSFDSKNINPVMWSLAHEMRISIIFPILMLIVLKLRAITTIIIALVVSFSAYLTMYFVGNANGAISFLYTPHYASIFMIGALLARHIEYIVNKIKSLNRFMKIVLMLVAVLSYTYKWILYENRLLHPHDIVDEWMVVIGATLIILLSISTKGFSKLLNLKPIHFLGKISYSLYLYHILALLLSVHLINNYNAKPSIFIVSFILSFVLAILSYYYIELPSIKVGKYFSSKKSVSPLLDKKPSANN